MLADDYETMHTNSLISLYYCSIKQMFRYFMGYQLQHIKSYFLLKTTPYYGSHWGNEHCASVRLHTFCLSENGTFALCQILFYFFTPPVPAVLTIEPSRTWLPAELPTVPWCTGTWAVRLVALAMDTLAVSLTTRTPQSFPALAASCELVAWWVVTVTLDSAVPPGPTRIAQASPCHCIADRVDAAVAVVVALGTPDARVTCAFARLLVTLALLA